jgi:hypothetical protein
MLDLDQRTTRGRPIIDASIWAIPGARALTGGNRLVVLGYCRRTGPDGTGDKAIPLALLPRAPALGPATSGARACASNSAIPARVLMEKDPYKKKKCESQVSKKYLRQSF